MDIIRKNQEKTEFSMPKLPLLIQVNGAEDYYFIVKSSVHSDKYYLVSLENGLTYDVHYDYEFLKHQFNVKKWIPIEVDLVER